MRYECIPEFIENKEGKVWDDIRNMKRITDEFLELKSHLNDCWKRKQQRRIIDMIVVASKKEKDNGIR